MFGKFLGRCALLLPAMLASGCNMVVMNPAGDVALQQRNLIIVSTVLMLVVIIPVIVLTLLFAWRYRASNKAADYRPDWDHSTQLELVIWAAPLLIIIMLGAATWISTHTLDPYRRVSRIAAGKPLAKDTKGLEVQVVALDWKWLFVYPELGIATVNELAAPTGVPLDFRITSSTVMNSFFIPALAGQVYAMPGMETQLHAVLERAGDYEGFSANYSGAGFSDMRFTFTAMSAEDFKAWVAKVRADGGALKRADYLALEKPSIRVAPRRYAQVDADLYDRIVNLCVEPSKMCMRDMMGIDARGGLPVASARNLSRLPYDSTHARSFDGGRNEYVTALCAEDLRGAALIAAEDR